MTPVTVLATAERDGRRIRAAARGRPRPGHRPRHPGPCHQPRRDRALAREARL